MTSIIEYSEKNISQLLGKKKYEKVLDLYDSYQPINEVDIDKKTCNLSYVYYLMKNYETAKNVVLNVLIDRTQNIWPRLYYRLAKAYEGLQNYDLMCESYDNMYKLLENEERENNSSQHMQDYFNQDVLFMQQWLIANGGVIHNLQIEYYDVDYRGMKIATNVKPFEHLMEIPWKCIISLEESMKSNPYARRIIDANIKLNSIHSYLAMELLYIRHTETHHLLPYMRCLPKYFNNVPINFNIQELKNLEGSYAIIKIIQKLFILKIEYNAIIVVFPEGCPFTFADFVWARTLVITRVYAITKNGRQDTVMVPFADMANHETPPNTKWWFDNDSNNFIIEANTHLYNGDVIYETYGNKCNYRYFVNYGFTVNNNKHEEVSLVFNNLLNEIIDKFTQTIINYKNENALIGDVFEEMLDGYNNKEIINTFIDQILVEKSVYQVGYEFNESVAKMFNDLRGIEKMNRGIEILVHKTVLLAICHRLDRFITTTKDDELLLQQYDYNFNMHNIMVMCKEEKKVLYFWKELTMSIIEALESKETIKVAFRKMNKKLAKWPGIKSFALYFRQLETVFT